MAKPWMQLTQAEMRKQAEERIAVALGGMPQPQGQPSMSLMDRLSMGKDAMNNLKGAMNGQTRTQSATQGGSAGANSNQVPPRQSGVIQRPVSKPGQGGY